MQPALFLDRDGVIIEDEEYLSNPSQIRLIAGSAPAIAEVNLSGVPVIVATNQSGVARGYFAEECVAQMHLRLDALLAEHGAHIDQYYYCPHHPDKGLGRYRVDCDCRKPRPGMILRAA